MAKTRPQVVQGRCGRGGGLDAVTAPPPGATSRPGPGASASGSWARRSGRRFPYGATDPASRPFWGGRDPPGQPCGPEARLWWNGSLGLSCHTRHLRCTVVEFWAQRTVSPMDGREGWTVVNDSYVEHDRAAQYLRSIVDRGGSVGTARASAGRLALWLSWTSAAHADDASPGVEELAAFARWLERTPSRKHRRGRNRRRATDRNVVILGAARSAATAAKIPSTVAA